MAENPDAGCPMALLLFIITIYVVDHSLSRSCDEPCIRRASRFPNRNYGLS